MKQQKYITPATQGKLPNRNKNVAGNTPIQHV